MNVSTSDAMSCLCGKKSHSNCQGLAIEHETDRQLRPTAKIPLQGNTMFLQKGLAPVKEVMPWDEVKLIDVGLKEQYNDADYAVVALSSSRSII